MNTVSNNAANINTVRVRNKNTCPANRVYFGRQVTSDVFVKQNSNLNKSAQVSFTGLKEYLEQKYIFKPRKDEQIIDLDTLYKYKEITVNSTDGVQLKQWYVKPQPDKPTMLFCHGQNCNVTHHQDIVKFLYNNGYGGILVDYRGYRKNTGKPSEQGLYDDALAGLKFLHSQGIKNKDIIVWGHSLGGGVASELAAKGNFRALVLESTFASIKHMQDYMLSPEFAKGKPLSERIKLFLLKLIPERARAFKTKFDNVSKIKTVDYPVLIVHSKTDKKVPFRMSQILSAAQPKAEFVAFEEGVHHKHDWSIDTIKGFIEKVSS